MFKMVISRMKLQYVSNLQSRFLSLFNESVPGILRKVKARTLGGKLVLLNSYELNVVLRFFTFNKAYMR